MVRSTYTWCAGTQYVHVVCIWYAVRTRGVHMVRSTYTWCAYGTHRPKCLPLARKRSTPAAVATICRMIKSGLPVHHCRDGKRRVNKFDFIKFYLPLSSPPQGAVCWHQSQLGDGERAAECDADTVGCGVLLLYSPCGDMEADDDASPPPPPGTKLKHRRFRGRESLTPLGRPLVRANPAPPDEEAPEGEGERSSACDSSDATLPGGGASREQAAAAFLFSSWR
jgi:hypothetical protein